MHPACALVTPATSRSISKSWPALVSDLSVSSVVVILLTLTVILVFFRWWKSVFALLVPPHAGRPLRHRARHFATREHRRAELEHGLPGLGDRRQRHQFWRDFAGALPEERRSGKAIAESLAIAIWGSRSGTWWPHWRLPRPTAR